MIREMREKLDLYEELNNIFSEFAWMIRNMIETIEEKY